MPGNHCSNCGRENAPGALTCADCGWDFRGQPEARSIVLRTFASQTEAQIVAKHLEDAKIPAMVTADDAGGMLPFLNITGSIRLLVSESDWPRAETALRQFEEAMGAKWEPMLAGAVKPPPLPLAPAPKRTPNLGVLALFLLSGLVGWMAHYAMTMKRTYSGTVPEDLNQDGRPDAWTTYEKDQMTGFSQDRNFDGRVDFTTFYKKGSFVAGENDENFDGNTDWWSTYSNDVITLSRLDVDHDGRPDGETRSVFGVPVETIFAVSNQLGYWKRDFYTNGLLRQSDIDRDRNGVLDERVFFDPYGVVLKSERLN